MCPGRRLRLADRALGCFDLRRITKNDRNYKDGYEQVKAPSDPPLDNPDMGWFHRLLAGMGLVASTWPHPDKDPFYGINSKPAALQNHKPGDVLRWRPIEITSFPGLDAEHLKAYQIAFVTTDDVGLDGNNLYATGGRTQIGIATVMVPPKATFDKVLSMQPKTDGANSICRTSYSLRKGTEDRFASLSESAFLPPFFDEGWVVSIPDLGGQFDAFGDGLGSGRLVLDSMKAMIKLRDTIGLKSLDQGLRFGLWGYSAGAQATFWAAQLQHKYAPELDNHVVGYAGGGLPADLEACAHRLNHNFAAGLIVGIVAGLSNAYPDFARKVNSLLTKKGHSLYDIALQKCWADYMLASFGKDVLTGPPDGYFNVNDPLSDPIVQSKLAKNNLLLAAQHHAPQVPLYLTGSLVDEAIPPEQMQMVTDAWAKGNATIELIKDQTPGHALNCFTSYPGTVRWLRERFDGKENAAKPGKPVVRTVLNGLMSLDSPEAKQEVNEKHLHRIKVAAQLFSDDHKAWWY